MDSHGHEAFMFASELPPLTSSSSIQAAWPPPSAVNPMNPTAPDTTHFLPCSIYGGATSTAMQFSDHVGGGGGGGGDFPGLGGLYVASSSQSRSSSSPFGSLPAEMTAREVTDAKALAASRSHSEAERRRRERINAHMAMLRSLLPSRTKTDKASLLAEVIQHVKELKRQTSSMAAVEDHSPLPTETNELTLATANRDHHGRFVVKLSLCCDDRSDLIPDLARALESLRLRTLKAEFTTLGGRARNVLVVAGEEEDDDTEQHQSSLMSSIRDAIRGVMERSTATSTADASSRPGGGVKRQRTNDVCLH
ncbi:putative transcription factor bHLH30 [Iris pallida]|uniref:Transcription factor bHLH30 n=1 Tax=Iris pallida TaxID=29817 RepID=A0AAX6FCC1_IRIPA|nr:putative transcription factor bHLH30 [Iris pallida]